MAGFGEGEHPADRTLLPGAVGDGNAHLLRVRPPGGQLSQLPARPEFAFDVLRYPGIGRAGVSEADISAALVEDRRRHPAAHAVRFHRDVDVDELPGGRQLVNTDQREIGAELVHDELQRDATRAAASNEEKAPHYVSHQSVVASLAAGLSALRGGATCVRSAV